MKTSQHFYSWLQRIFLIILTQNIYCGVSWIDNTIDIEDVPQDTDYEQELIEEALYVKYLEDSVPERFINQISKQEQELYFLKYIEKRTNEDIAKILNISVNAVASRTLRLKQKFKDEFL